MSDEADIDEQLGEILDRIDAGGMLTEEERAALMDWAGSEASEAVGVVEGLRVAANRSGFSLRVVRGAKSLGSGAFRLGNRVHVGELRLFVAEHLEELREELETAPDGVKGEIDKERLRKLKIENDLKEGLTLPKEGVEAAFENLALDLKGLLRDRLETSLPTKLAGKSVEEIRPLMRDTVDEICAALEKGRGSWRQ